MALRWPFTVKSAVDHIQAAEGDRVLADGTRIVARDWGGLWDAIVLPAEGSGFRTDGVMVRTKTKALDKAEAEWLRKRRAR